MLAMLGFMTVFRDTNFSFDGDRWCHYVFTLFIGFLQGCVSLKFPLK